MSSKHTHLVTLPEFALATAKTIAGKDAEIAALRRVMEVIAIKPIISSDAAEHAYELRDMAREVMFALYGVHALTIGVKHDL